MDKIRELIKKLQGDPERCAKCAEDIDFSCPYAGDPDGCNSPTRGRFPVRTDEIADELEKELQSVQTRVDGLEKFVKKFIAYAGLVMKVGFYNSDNLQRMIDKAKEVLNEQD